MEFAWLKWKSSQGSASSRLLAAAAHVFFPSGTHPHPRSRSRSNAGCRSNSFNSKLRNFETIGPQRAVPTPRSAIGARLGATGSSTRWSEVMALVESGAPAPERLTLPDVRRLEQTPSLPAWVDSLVASMTDEWQRSMSDGQY